MHHSTAGSSSHHHGPLPPAPACPRSQNGLLLGIPVVFDTDREDVAVGDKVLITYKGQNIGVLTVESKWCPDKVRS